jgi:hypothetical protein
MRLLHRHASPSELWECVQYSPVRVRYGGSFGRLAEVWSALLQQGSAISAVVEDLDHAAENRLLAFGISVFLTDEFVRQAKTPPLFWIGPELIRCTIKNDSPILNQAEIGRANSGDGLNLFVWEVCTDPTVEAELLAVTGELGKAFVEYHAGFRIKEVMGQHPFGRVLRGAIEGGGWLVENRIGEYVPVDDPGAIERAGAPFVLGLTRELARKNPGSFLSLIFDYKPPRLFLRPAEQRLLDAALGGGTDEEIAEALGVSVSAVKKCWQSVYGRVGLRLPELVPGNAMSDGVRGTEKKRRLLAYLRDHPEEMRPILPASARRRPLALEGEPAK